MRTNILNRIKRIEKAIPESDKFPKHIIERINNAGFEVIYSKKEGWHIAPKPFDLLRKGLTKYRKARNISTLEELLTVVGYDVAVTGRIKFCSIQKFYTIYKDIKQKIYSDSPKFDCSKYKDQIYREVPKAAERN